MENKTPQKNGTDCLIVKRFPKNYIVFNNAMQKVLAPHECCAVISHHGTNEEGLEVYILETGNFYQHFQQAVGELQYLREVEAAALSNQG